MSRNTTDVDDVWTIQIAGRNPVSLSLGGGSADWPLVRQSFGYECASGDWIDGEWIGIPVIELIAAAAMPEETTHLQIESASGDLACVDLLALEGAILALAGEERSGEPGAADSDGDGGVSLEVDRDYAASEFPRFLAPGILGPRTVKNVTAIRPLILDAGEQPESYEDLPIDD